MKKYFRIENSNGKSYNLKLEENLLYNLSGFGFETDTTFENVASTYVTTKHELKQPKLTGSILLGGMYAYSEYKDFVNFLRDEPLTIYYQPELIEYNMRAVVTKLTKKELGNNYLEVACTFDGLERFSRDIEYKSGEWSETETTNGKQYNYPYNYVYSASNNARRQAVVYIASNLPAPVEIEIKGAVDSPIWRHYLNSKLIASGKVNYYIKDTERFRISTLDGMEMCIVDEQTGATRNGYEYSDYNTERFIYMKRGENVLVLTTDNGDEVEFSIRVKEYYASV